MIFSASRALLQLLCLRSIFATTAVEIDVQDTHRRYFESIREEYRDSIDMIDKFLVIRKFGGSEDTQIRDFVHDVVNPAFSNTMNSFEAYNVADNTLAKDNMLSHFFFDIFSPDMLKSKLRILPTILSVSASEADHAARKCMFADHMMTEVLAIGAIPSEFEKNIPRHIINFCLGALSLLVDEYGNDKENGVLEGKYLEPIMSSAVVVERLMNEMLELAFTTQREADSGNTVFVKRADADKAALAVSIENLDNQVRNFRLHSEALLNIVSQTKQANVPGAYRETILNAINLMEMVASIRDITVSFVQDVHYGILSQMLSSTPYASRFKCFEGYFSLSKQMIYFAVAKRHFHSRFVTKLTDTPPSGFMDYLSHGARRFYGLFVSQKPAGSDAYFGDGVYCDYLQQISDIVSDTATTTALVVVPEADDKKTEVVTETVVSVTATKGEEKPSRGTKWYELVLYTLALAVVGVGAYYFYAKYVKINEVD